VIDDAAPGPWAGAPATVAATPGRLRILFTIPLAVEHPAERQMPGARMAQAAGTGRSELGEAVLHAEDGERVRARNILMFTASPTKITVFTASG